MIFINFYTCTVYNLSIAYIIGLYLENFISDGKPTQQSSTYGRHSSDLPVSLGHNTCVI